MADYSGTGFEPDVSLGEEDLSPAESEEFGTCEE